MDSCGVTTIGFAGRRSSTGGSAPAATRSASIGASPNVAASATVKANAVRGAYRRWPKPLVDPLS